MQVQVAKKSDEQEKKDAKIPQSVPYDDNSDLLNRLANAAESEDEGTDFDAMDDGSEMMDDGGCTC